MLGQASASSADSAALLNGALEVLELIATGAPLETTLNALCEVIDAQCGGLISTVYLLDADGSHLRFAAGPRVPTAFLGSRRSFAVTATSSGACGAAVSSREPVIVADALVSPLYASWRAVMVETGIRSVWSTPLCSRDGRVLGTLALLGMEPGMANDAFLALVKRSAHLATIAIERNETDAHLRESELRFSRVFYLNPASMTITSYADGKFAYVNDAFVRMFGFSRAEAVGQTALSLGLYADPNSRTGTMERLGQNDAYAIEVKGRTKTGRVLDVVVSMARIEILGQERVLTIATDVTERRHAEERLRDNERLMRLVLDAIPVGVAVVDPQGDVILNNPAVEHIWGGPVVKFGPDRYERSKGWWHDSGRRVEPGEWASVRARTAGETSLNEVIDIETFDGASKIIHNSAVPIRDEQQRIVGAVIVNEDITERKAAEQSLEASVDKMQILATRLMHAQDDERRRIAQMLHETTAQDLAALKMMLARVNRTSANLTTADRELLEEASEVAERSMAGIRTLSYLLHPPFLDENGLLAAIRWYVEGFSKRSGINIDLDLPETLERLPQVIETTLFRIVQEALINIHRHAKSPTARLRLRAMSGALSLEIQDRGRGIPRDFVTHLMDGTGAFGVGVAGMRERLKRLGGSFAIESGTDGTTIRVSVPLPAVES